MNLPDPFISIAKELNKFRSSNPNSRRFPLSLWQKIVPLSQQYPISEICQRLQISPGNLARRIKQLKSHTKSRSAKIPMLVEVPLPPTRPCIMELEYPNGIKVRLFAQ